MRGWPTTTDEPICLTEDETAALRTILAALATIGESSYFNERRMVEITPETWHELLVKPAQRLRRVTARKLPART